MLLVAGSFPFTISGGDFILNGQPVFLNIIGYSPLAPGQVVSEPLQEARLHDDLRRFQGLADDIEGPVILRIYPQPTAATPVRLPQFFYDGLRDLDWWFIRDVYFDGNLNEPDAMTDAITAVDRVFGELDATGAWDREFAIEVGNEFLGSPFEASNPTQATQLTNLIDAMGDHVKQELAKPVHAGHSNWFTWGSLPPYDLLRSDQDGSIPVVPQSVDFFSYNVYPYFPEGLREQQAGSVTGTPYAGYLEALRQTLDPAKPLVISELGLPASPAVGSGSDQARLHPWYPVYRYGGLTDEQVSEALVDRYVDARLSGATDGAAIFLWNDEWWKEGNPQQLDPGPEEHFGIAGFEQTGPSAFELHYKLQQEAVRQLFGVHPAAPGQVVNSLSADQMSLQLGESTFLHAVVNGSAALPVSFRWESNHGRVVGEGNSPQFFAGDVALGPALITMVAMDATGRSETRSLSIDITPAGPPSLELLTSGGSRASGRVRNVDPSQFKVVLYVEVPGDKLYQQPFLANAAAPAMTSIWIDPDGYFWSPTHSSPGNSHVAWLVPIGAAVNPNPSVGYVPPGEIAESRIVGINDTDNDLLPDSWELAMLGGLADDRYGDGDGDFAQNWEEFLAGGNPQVADNDADSDSLPDNWERQLLRTTSYGANDDPDQDGVSNLQEYLRGIHPGRIAHDSDADGLPDRWERKQLGSLAATAGQNADNDLLTNGQAYELGYPAISPFPWHNPVLALDVSRDGQIVARDALLIINQLNVPTLADALGHLPLPRTASHPLLDYDTFPDGFLVARDALLIINYINRPQPPAGEGEAGSSFPSIAGDDFSAWSIASLLSLSDTPKKERQACLFWGVSEGGGMRG